METTTPYLAPDSDVIQKAYMPATFKTLSAGRKIWLSLMWIINIALSVSMIWMITRSEELLKEHNADRAEISPDLVAFIVIFLLAISVWHHYAIIKRKIGQITTLAILNLILGGNIIGCLIMFSIRSTTKKEIEEFEIS